MSAWRRLFEPIARIADGGGPMKTTPASRAGLRRSPRSRTGSRSRDGSPARRSPARPRGCARRAGSSRAARGRADEHGLVAGAHVLRAARRRRSRRRRCGCRGGARCAATRQAISPRLAIRIFSNIRRGQPAESPPRSLLPLAALGGPLLARPPKPASASPGTSGSLPCPRRTRARRRSASRCP